MEFNNCTSISEQMKEEKEKKQKPFNEPNELNRRKKQNMCFEEISRYIQMDSRYILFVFIVLFFSSQL